MKGIKEKMNAAKASARDDDDDDKERAIARVGVRVAEEETTPTDRLTRKLRSGRRSTATSATSALGTGSSFSEAATSGPSFSASASASTSAPASGAAASSQHRNNQHISPGDAIQTPDERLSIKLQQNSGQSLRLSNVSGISSTGHEYRRTSTGADPIEEEHDENEGQQSQQRIAAGPAVGGTNPSAGVGGEASTSSSSTSSANGGETDLERADGSDIIAQAGEDEPPAESAAVVESAVVLVTSHGDSQQYSGSLPPVDDSPVALEAYTTEEMEYAKVVGETDVACMALRTKRSICVIIAFVLVVVAAIVAGVITTRPKGDDDAKQQAGPINKTSITQDNIKMAVDYWIADPEAAAKQYGHISTWDTSSVTSLNGLFQGYNTFNEDLSAWNTSAVETMSQVFSGAKSFNSDLSGWDTRKVRTMEGMFRGASSFAGDLSSWDTGNVQRMNNMFYDAASFTSTLCWDLSSITTATQFEHGFGVCKSSNIKTCRMLCNSGARLDPSCATSEMIEAALECPSPSG